MNKNKLRSPVWQISKFDLSDLIKKKSTIGEILRYFGLKNHGSNYKTLHRRVTYDCLSLEKFKNNFGKGLRSIIPLKDLLIQNSKHCVSTIRRRVLKENLIIKKCAICGLLEEWNGKRLSLVLDHVNGINNDHRLINLRLLCPNCHSQTITFAGRKLRIKRNCKECGKIISKGSVFCNRCKKTGLKCKLPPTRQESK